jgi:hypothetical protein
MQKMENWAHRLYPKLQFDDFMDKVERLGSKKDVQVGLLSPAYCSKIYWLILQCNKKKHLAVFMNLRRYVLLQLY